MTKSCKELYAKFSEIQGDNPIYIGSKMTTRIELHEYKERIMRQIVGLLETFSKIYEPTKKDRNTRYATTFVFNGVFGDKCSYTGPYLLVMDAIEEKLVSLIAWNGGNLPIITFSENESSFVYEVDYDRAIRRLRKKLLLPDTRTWASVDMEMVRYILENDYTSSDILDKHDKTWKEIDNSHMLSPIKGLDIVYIKQISTFLKVSTNILIELRKSIDKFFLNDIGFRFIPLDQVAIKLGLKYEAGDELSVVLENNNELILPHTAGYFLTPLAASWFIEWVQSQPSYKHYCEMYEKKSKYESLASLEDVSWSDIGISPIVGIDKVSISQISEHLNIDIAVAQKAKSSIASCLRKCGTATINQNDLIKINKPVSRNEDLSYNLLLENGKTVSIKGRQTYFSPSAALCLIERCKSINDLE